MHLGVKFASCKTIHNARVKTAKSAEINNAAVLTSVFVSRRALASGSLLSESLKLSPDASAFRLRFEKRFYELIPATRSTSRRINPSVSTDSARTRLEDSETTDVIHAPLSHR